MAEELIEVTKDPASCSLYEIARPDGEPLTRYIASTPGTRKICNDPFLVGLEYTHALQHSCEGVLSALRNTNSFIFKEEEGIVLNLLRGGLNFGLREALGSAYGWNMHASNFISAQRARKTENPEEWHITEASYKKVQVPPVCSIFFGDVVATGTSCHFALKNICSSVEAQKSQIRNIFFFTIGSYRSEELLRDVDAQCREMFPLYEGSIMIYLEGRFQVAQPNTKLSIKITGTDLLRSEALVAPEFLESQYEDPAYPIERCTIYDAGSRAFWLPEYLEDVREYWEETSKLAEGGMSFEQLLQERYPELDSSRFASVDLKNLCASQLEKLP